jgi:hypothetical protein
MALKPERGDIICADRGLYRHYGIYAGNGSVIHYASNKGDFGKSVCVRKTSLGRFRKKSPCYVCRLPKSFTGTHKVFSPEQTLERALSRLGEASYCLFSNNCEHFVLWCKTGYAESEQVERFKVLLSSLSLIRKGKPLLARPELRDEIRGIVINGIFDFFDTVCGGLYALSEKVGRLDTSGNSR